MAEDRKARLAALAARAGRKGRNNDANGDFHDDKSEEFSSKPHEELEGSKTKTMVFRNYVPNDKSLENDSVEPHKKRLKQNEGSQDMDDSLRASSELDIALMQAKTEASAIVKDSSFPAQHDASAVNLITASKKVNWDLKRDIAKKIHRLERRTQKAVVDLLRSRLEKEAEVEENDLD